ncbi:MAG: hypothetical protein AABW63_00255 [Nanoarchaeota archaeon]
MGNDHREEGSVGRFSSPPHDPEREYVTRFDKRYISKGKFWTTVVASVAVLGLAGVIGGNYLANRQDKKIEPLVQEDQADRARDSVLDSSYAKLSSNFDSFKLYSDSVNEAQTNAISKLYSELSSEKSRRSALEDSLAANRENDDLNKEQYLALHKTDSTSIAKDSARIDNTESRLVNISKEVKYIGDVVSGNLDSIRAGFYNGVVGNYNVLRDALHQKLGYKKGWFNEFWKSSGSLPSLAKGNVLTKKELRKLMKTTTELGLSGKVDSLSGEISRGNMAIGDIEKNIKEIAFSIFEHNLNTGIYKRWNEGNEYFISKVDSAWVDSVRIANTGH